MGYNQGLAIAHGLARGMEKAATNIYNIRQAKHKQKMLDEAFKLDTKVKNAALDKQEFLYGEDAVKHKREMDKAEVASHKSAYNLNMIKIENAEKDETRKAEQYATGMKVWKTQLENGLPENLRFDFKDFTIKERSPKDTYERIMMKPENTRTQENMDTVARYEDMLRRKTGITGRGNLEDQFDDIFKSELGSAGGDNTDLKQKAMAELESAGYPVTEANIKEVMRQLSEG